MALKVDTVNEMIELYKAGNSVEQIAKKLKVKVSSVYYYFKKAGFQPQHKSEESKEIEKKVISLYLETELSIINISKKVGISVQYSNSLLRRSGVERNRRSVSDHEKKIIIERYKEGERISQLSESTGHGIQSIRNWVKEADVYYDQKKFNPDANLDYVYRFIEEEGTFHLKKVKLEDVTNQAGNDK